MRLLIDLSSDSGASLLRVQERGRSGVACQGEDISRHLSCRLDTHKCSEAETLLFPGFDQMKDNRPQRILRAKLPDLHTFPVPRNLYFLYLDSKHA